MNNTFEKSQNLKAYFMLVCATLFWAGNFNMGKFAFIENISPFTLAFLRWLIVWIILMPFTYKEILSLKKIIIKNFKLLFLLGLSSVFLFTALTYKALNYTQVINASLFNTAIPATIILVCFLLKIEKTNIFQLSGLDILLSLAFNTGDLFMIAAIISWGVYSAFLKKRNFEISLLALVQIICTFGLLMLAPAFLIEVNQGNSINLNLNLIYILLYVAVFPSIGSYYCWAGAVSIIGPNRSGIFLSLIPLFSTIFAMIFFDEKFLFYHLIGTVLIILGLFLSNKKIINV